MIILTNPMMKMTKICKFAIVKLRRGSGKDWQGMAPKAEGLKA